MAGNYRRGARGRAVGSFDRTTRGPDGPKPPDNPEQAAERLHAVRAADAEVVERYGLSKLTRSGTFESQSSRADAQDAGFRKRLAAEESGSAGTPREPLTDRGGGKDRGNGSTDRPEQDLERPRSYWTEVPRFLAMWGRHKDQWPPTPRPPDRSLQPEQRIEVADSADRIARAEPKVSSDMSRIATEADHRGWLEGFDFRLKGRDRLEQKVASGVETSAPDASVDELVDQIPDAIRYTFCFDASDYTAGCREVKERMGASGYEMYHS